MKLFKKFPVSLFGMKKVQGVPFVLRSDVIPDNPLYKEIWRRIPKDVYWELYGIDDGELYFYWYWDLYTLVKHLSANEIFDKFFLWGIDAAPVVIPYREYNSKEELEEEKKNVNCQVVFYDLNLNRK